MIERYKSVFYWLGLAILIYMVAVFAATAIPFAFPAQISATSWIAFPLIWIGFLTPYLIGLSRLDVVPGNRWARAVLIFSLLLGLTLILPYWRINPPTEMTVDLVVQKKVFAFSSLNMFFSLQSLTTPLVLALSLILLDMKRGSAQVA